jgi:precorrin-8X/cobalt-precorrin-8 methylmutase
MRNVHPIEQESYAILRARADTSAFPLFTRAVIERVVHSSADLDYLADLVCTERTLAAAHEALEQGAPIVADVEMVAAGITSRPVLCKVRDPRAADLAAGAGITRSAAGIRLAFDEVGPGAVWAIGNAPTALFELLNLDARPALVVGLPVGFVGAADSKAALRRSGLPAISNVSDKGGSAVAAAAVNALLYLEPADEEQHP